MTDQESIYVKEALEERVKVIHSWTHSFRVGSGDWYYAQIVYDKNGPTDLVGPYSARAALIQLCYEKVYDTIWRMVNK